MNFGGNHILKLLTLSTILVVILQIHKGMAKPLQEEQKREKRSGISDQRLAELETLLELKRLRETLRTRTPVAYGLFDPAKIGKRRKREHYFKTNSYDRNLMEEDVRTESPINLGTYEYQE